MQTSSPSDLGWFTPPDLDLLFTALSRLPNPGSIILIGGQSLSFWVDYFDIPMPRLESLYLTQDADFLGTHRDAELLAKELGAEIRLATMDDNTSNLATLLYQGLEGKKLLIDILSVVIGLDESEVKKRAIMIEGRGQQLHILHPLLCLKSRIENLRTLPSKRNGNGISQTQVAVEVARKYIGALLSQPTERDAINAVHQIKDMAWSRAGLFVFKEYRIDLLRAVELEKFHSVPFREKDWPNILRWITDRRNRSSRTALRLEAMALAKKHQG